MNGQDVLLLAAIAAACFFAARKIHRDKKHGRSCCGNCTGCATPCKNKEEDSL